MMVAAKSRTNNHSSVFMVKVPNFWRTAVDVNPSTTSYQEWRMYNPAIWRRCAPTSARPVNRKLWL